MALKTQRTQRAAETTENKKAAQLWRLAICIRSASNVILLQIAAAAFQEMPKRLLQNPVSYLIQFVFYAPDPNDFSNRLRHWHPVTS
jgi:hypothetical protein